jgi:hypothetical protein
VKSEQVRAAVAMVVARAVMLGGTAVLAAVVGERYARQREGRCRECCNKDPSHL